MKLGSKKPLIILLNGEITCKYFNKPRLVQTKKLKELLEDF